MPANFLYAHTILAALWLIFFGAHSFFASLRFKAWLARNSPTMHRRLRLIYNFVALLLVVPPAWSMHTMPTVQLWAWSGGAELITNTLALGALALFLWSLRYYSGLDFLGLARNGPLRPRLVLSPLHGVVRHPWYSLALVLIWTRDMNSAFLLSASLMTLYFVVGSMLEEKKLRVEFGEAYRLYQSRVPRLLPWPTRTLNEPERRALEQHAAEYVVATMPNKDAPEPRGN